MSSNIGQTQIVIGNTITNSNLKFYQIQNASSEPTIINDLDFEMPTLSKYSFIGREVNMQEIFEKLKSFHHVAIHGIGGLGKTALAVHCAKMWQTHFGNTAFLTVDNRENFESCTKRLASKLKINKGQSLLEIWKDIMKLYKDKELLVIFDNLNNLSDIDEILYGLEANNLYALVTTQNIEVDVHFECYKLNVLTPKDGLDLMFSIINHNIEEENEKIKERFLLVLRQIYDILEGLPLSLAHCACWVVETMKTKIRIGKIEKSTNSYIILLEEYLNTFKNRLKENFPKQYETKTSKSAFLALQLNIDRLSCTESKQLLFLLGYLNPIEIKINMFKVLFKENDFDTALVDLSKYCLIFIDHVQDVLKKEVALIRIHRVVQDVSRIHMKSFRTQLPLLLIKLFCNDNLSFRHLDTILKCINEDFQLCNLFQLCSKEELELTINEIFDSHPNLDISITSLQNAGCYIKDRNWPVPHKIVSMITVMVVDKSFTILLKQIFEVFDNFRSVIGDGITLHHLAASNVNTSFGEFYKFLQKVGVDIHTTTSRGVSPLHVAAVATKSWDMNEADIEQIVSLGVSVYLTDVNKNTPLHLAAKFGKLTSINSLLSMVNTKKYINLENSQGRTPLYLAVAGGFYKDVFGGNPVLSLLEAGARYNFTFQNGQNLLHKSVQSGSLHVVRFICRQMESNGICVDDVDDSGNTAAHIVLNLENMKNEFENIDDASNYIQQAITLLVKTGANLKLKNHAGQTPLDVATKNGLIKVVETICQKKFTKT